MKKFLRFINTTVEMEKVTLVQVYLLAILFGFILHEVVRIIRGLPTEQ